MTVAIAIHGGAGTIPRADMTKKREAAYRKGLAAALDAGYAVLKKKGTAMDAVCAAVVELEDDPLFNAGRGACFNTDERIELDASVMDGATLRAGAIAAVKRVRNPVLGARAVMERSRHVLLVGPGAERFARKCRVELVPESYFETPSRLEALRKRLQGNRGKDHHGTVGAVALDAFGNLAAATSTGGYTGKLPGRVGDSPIIGAGNYADNGSCAVSGTGLGEAFIRAVLAYDVSARMRYKREPLARAAAAALDKVRMLKGDGGLIAVDRRGNIAMPFHSQGMYRAAIDRHGRRRIAIY